MSRNKQKWVQCKDSKGNPYYYNPETGVSEREKPADYIPASESRKASSLESTPKTPNEDSKKSRSSPLDKQSGEQNDKKDKSSTPKFNKKPSPSDTFLSKNLPLTEKSKVRQFKNLLSEHVVSSETTWDKAVESMKNDSRFSLLPTREMKKLFSLYKDKKDQDEKLSKTEFEVKKKKVPTEFLIKDSRMSAIISYSEADELYENEEAWTNIDSDTRQKIFEKMKPILFNKEVKRLKVVRDENIKKINTIFQKLNKITYQTTWAEAQRYLLEDEEFLADEDLKSMDKEDAFNVFQTLIKKLEALHAEERAFIAKTTEIVYAEYRSNFVGLLRKLKRDHRLHCDSLWKDIFPYIKNHPSFLNMLAIPGSTPLDIFKIYVHDLKYNYSHDISVIANLLKNFHYEITLKTSLDSFVNMIRSTREGSKVRTSNIHYYYHSVLNRLKSTKKASEPMTPYERKRVDFKRLLYKLGADVLTKDCIYSNLLTRIIDSNEYKNFNDESEKYKIFKKMKRHFHGNSRKESENYNTSTDSESSESDFENDRKSFSMH